MHCAIYAEIYSPIWSVDPRLSTIRSRSDGDDPNHHDIQALFDLLMGVGMLAGEFVPFFLALVIMFSIDPTLTLWLLIAVPVFAVITLIFRHATRRVYRDIRSSVSQLNQYLQENLSGIQIVQLSNREARNQATYEAINATNQTRKSKPFG